MDLLFRREGRWSGGLGDKGVSDTHAFCIVGLQWQAGRQPVGWWRVAQLVYCAKLSRDLEGIDMSNIISDDGGRPTRRAAARVDFK
jgi:hypothetical protein